jgi:hypothetical protein
LEETKDKVAEHESGRSLLEGEEYATLKKRIGLYEKKVSTAVGVLVEDTWMDFLHEISIS